MPLLCFVFDPVWYLLNALKLSYDEGKGEARKVRWVMFSRRVAQINFIIFPYKSRVLTSLAILVTVFHKREFYLINNTQRTFRAWILPFSFIIAQTQCVYYACREENGHWVHFDLFFYCSGDVKSY